MFLKEANEFAFDHFEVLEKIYADIYNRDEPHEPPKNPDDYDWSLDPMPEEKRKEI